MNTSFFGLLTTSRSSSTPSGGGFSPSDIINLVAWYDADDITGNDGDTISAWTDKSGNGRNMTSAIGSPVVKVNIVNSHRTARFTPSQAILVASFGTDVEEMFIVASWRGTLPEAGYPGPAGGENSGGSGVGNYIFLNSSSLGTDSATIEYYPANPQTQNVFFSATVASESTTSLDQFAIGRRNFGYWNGDVAVVLCYSRTLTSGERASLFQWAEDTYGVAYP